MTGNAHHNLSIKYQHERLRVIKVGAKIPLTSNFQGNKLPKIFSVQVFVWGMRWIDWILGRFQSRHKRKHDILHFRLFLTSTKCQNHCSTFICRASLLKIFWSRFGPYNINKVTADGLNGHFSVWSFFWREERSFLCILVLVECNCYLICNKCNIEMNALILFRREWETYLEKDIQRNKVKVPAIA